MYWSIHKIIKSVPFFVNLCILICCKSEKIAQFLGWNQLTTRFVAHGILLWMVGHQVLYRYFKDNTRFFFQPSISCDLSWNGRTTPAVRYGEKPRCLEPAGFHEARFYPQNSPVHRTENCQVCKATITDGICNGRRLLFVQFLFRQGGKRPPAEPPMWNEVTPYGDT